MEKLKVALAPYVEKLANKSRFVVDAVDKVGKNVQITSEDADTFIIMETAGNRARIGLITRAIRDRYSFLRVQRPRN